MAIQKIFGYSAYKFL